MRFNSMISMFVPEFKVKYFFTVCGLLIVLWKKGMTYSATIRPDKRLVKSESWIFRGLFMIGCMSISLGKTEYFEG